MGDDAKTELARCKHCLTIYAYNWARGSNGFCRDCQGKSTHWLMRPIKKIA